MDIEGRDESVALGRIRNITFSDIHITTVNGNCVFLGMPDHFIENITLDNVRMHVLERGDLSTRHKPRGNRKIKYKAVNDYAHIHAHFTIAYAKGFNVRNLYIQDETDSELFERTCIWCLNVSDLVIENFQNQQTFFNKTNPFIHLTNCKGAQIRHCLPQATDAGFVKIEGEKSSKISLIGNDLSQHAQPILLGNDVKQSILYKINNRIKQY